MFWSSGRCVTLATKYFYLIKLDNNSMPLTLEEYQVDSKIAYEGTFLKVLSDTILLPNGKTSRREFVKHPGAVVILPIFDDETILLERQFRYPLNQVFIEFPAGKIDANENSLTCAKRELKEETGYTAEDWKFVCTIHNAIAYSDEYLDIFVARGLNEGERQLDEEEFLETFKSSIPEMLTLIREGKITDVKTVIGVFWLEKIFGGQWNL